MKSSKWQLDEEASNRRSNVFWQLFHKDAWLVSEQFLLYGYILNYVRVSALDGLHAYRWRSSTVISRRIPRKRWMQTESATGVVSIIFFMSKSCTIEMAIRSSLDMAVCETTAPCHEYCVRCKSSTICYSARTG